MAKKVKTPEEVQAKFDKKTWKRKIFFGTFTKTLAFFLAIAMVFSLAMIAFQTPATTASAGGNNSVSTDGGSGSTDDQIDFDGGDAQTPGDDAQTPGDDAQTPDGDAQTPDGGKKLSYAEAAELLNKVTAAAAKGSYNMKRVCDYTSDGAINLGSTRAKDAIDGVIKTVVTQNDWPDDDNATLDSIVGNFIGIGTQDAKVSGGKAPEGVNANYLLKGMSLTAGDLMQYVPNGNVHQFQLKVSSNPQRDNGTPLAKATNDFITHSEVDENLKIGLGSVGAALLRLDSSDVSYKQIIVKATIENDKLTNLEMSFIFDAKLELKATFLPITGTGKAQTKLTYSNIAY